MNYKKKWLVSNKITDIDLNKYAEIDPIVLQFLFARGIKTQNEINEFLNPNYSEDLHDPFLFVDMKKAIAKIFDAIKNNQKIGIHGDYDADGVCSSAILYETITALGGKDVIVYLPHREKDGYGLGKKSIDFLHEANVKLVITTDCGITNVTEIEQAQELGMEVIVTDHHKPHDTIPDCLIIHPQLEREKYPFKFLAGGGVAFKLAQGLLKTQSKKDNNTTKWESFEKWLLDLVAISTVADMVPLIGENRTLVKYGLIVLNKVRRKGLKYLFTEIGLDINPNNLDLNTYNIGFQIGPRINAAGRMDHSNTAYELLVATDNEKAKILAKKLNKNNEERKTKTLEMVEEAKEQIGEVKSEDINILFAYNKDWLLGIAGLVAGKLADEYQKPVVIMGQLNNKIAGSVRSIKAFNFIEALIRHKDFFDKFGGHPQACGFTLKQETTLENFKNALNKEIKDNISLEDIIPSIKIDIEIDLSDVSIELFLNLSKMEPFGQKNGKPKFLSRNVTLGTCNEIGETGKHLKLKFSDKNKKTHEAIGFSFGHLCKDFSSGEKLDIVYEIDLNEWRGCTNIQLKIVDIKKTEDLSIKIIT